MPLPYRWLTSLMARYNGSAILIDCGEGTQIAMNEKGWSPKPIDIMCFTHYMRIILQDFRVCSSPWEMQRRQHHFL